MPVICIDCQLPDDACECDDDPRFNVIVTPEDRETNEQIKDSFAKFMKPFQDFDAEDSHPPPPAKDGED